MSFSNIFDAHAHYDDEQFDPDRDELLRSLPEKGVCGVVNASVNLQTAKTALGFADKYDCIYAAVGFHPENLGDAPADYLSQMEALLHHKKAVAVGEIGLDYHWDIPRDLQHKFFGEQLAFANDLNLPVVVHDREAHQDTLDFIKKYRPKKCLVHCYSGSTELLSEFLRFGCYISLGGAVTFKNAKHPLRSAAAVPADRLLLETDAPYMSPVPFRGKRCDSSMIIYTAQKIAELRSMGVQELLTLTAQNAQAFYGIS